MARKPRRLTVRIVPNALSQLDDIWLWNAKRYGAAHAAEYVAFLLQRTNRLGEEYSSGRVVSARPEYQFVVLRKGKKGHAHIAVYWVVEGVVEILHYFHSAQDWENKLATEET